MGLNNDHEKEVRKNQELGLELLNLANAKNTLAEETNRLRARVEELLGLQVCKSSSLEARREEWKSLTLSSGASG